MTIDGLRRVKLEHDLLDDIPDDTGTNIEPIEVIAADQQRVLCLEAYGQAFKRCKEEKEKVLLHEAYVEGIKAATIFTLHPDWYDNINDVYKAIRNLGERLERDPIINGIYQRYVGMQSGDITPMPQKQPPSRSTKRKKRRIKSA